MKKSYLIAATLIALILSACTSTSTPTAIPTVSLDNNSSSPSKQSSDANSVSASAIIVPLNDVQLSFSSVGRVTSVDVKVGDKVTAGQTLVTLDTTILEAKVREAEANVLAADAQIRYLNRLATDALHFNPPRQILPAHKRCLIPQRQRFLPNPRSLRLSMGPSYRLTSPLLKPLCLDRS